MKYIYLLEIFLNKKKLISENDIFKKNIYIS